LATSQASCNDPNEVMCVHAAALAEVQQCGCDALDAMVDDDSTEKLAAASEAGAMEAAPAAWRCAQH
jgi:hypothetical protein